MQDLQLLASSTIFMLFFTCQVIIVITVAVIDIVFMIVITNFVIDIIFIIVITTAFILTTVDIIVTTAVVNDMIFIVLNLCEKLRPRNDSRLKISPCKVHQGCA